MRKHMPRLTISVIIIMSMLLICWKPSELQQHSENNENDYYWLNPKGHDTREKLIGWVATSGNTALIFATDYKQYWSDPRRIFSFKLTTPSTTKRGVKMREIEGRVLAGHAVTYQDYSRTQARASGAAIGLLFIAYYKNDNYKQIIFAVAPFDADGKKTAKFQIIKTIDSEDTNLRFSQACIFAAVKDNTVAVAFCATSRTRIFPTYIAWTKAFFCETDLEGNVKFEPKLVKLPNNKGEYMMFELMHPVYHKGRWFIPGRSVNYDKSSLSLDLETEPVGSSLYVLTAKPKKSRPPKLKLITVESDDQANEDCTYAGLQFILPVSNTADLATTNIKKLMLMYQKRTFFPEGSEDPRDYDTAYYGRDTKLNGKTKKASKIAIPAWNPTLQREDGDIVSTSDETISRYIIGEDGTLLFGITRYQMIMRGAASSNDRRKEGELGTYDVAGRLQVYSFADVLRGLELIYEQNTNPFAKMVVGYFSGCIFFAGYWGYVWAAINMGQEFADALMVKMIIYYYIF